MLRGEEPLAVPGANSGIWAAGGAAGAAGAQGARLVLGERLEDAAQGTGVVGVSQPLWVAMFCGAFASRALDQRGETRSRDVG